MTLHLIARDLRIIFKDRGAMFLGFAVPVVLFTVFVLIFGGMGSSGDINSIHLIVVDEDDSPQSRRLVSLLEKLEPLRIRKNKKTGDSEEQIPYTAATAREAVAAGKVSTALVIPEDFARGLEEHLFADYDSLPALTILYDAAVPIESQVVRGLLQQVVFMSLTSTWAVKGIDIMAQELALDTDTSNRMTSWMTEVFEEVEQIQEAEEAGPDSTEAAGGGGFGSPIPIKTVDVLGESKRSPVAAMTAAQVVVMFLLFSVMYSAGSILQEQEGGTLRRLLISPMTDWQFLLAKVGSTTIFGFFQIMIMYLYGWIVFNVDLFRDFPAVVLMTAVTAVSATALGLLLASLCRSMKQVESISMLVVLSMSAIGGSMIPRFLMPKWMQDVGLLSFNAWAIDGFYKIFWREMGIVEILPQVGVLLAAGLVFFFIASHFFRQRFYA
ncbi:MAG: ABC transporter permease [Candidatus Eisenbacteria sp.]|nr:ABC transporter permease [Candidatus Eisenbacteria bacterium]